MDNNIKLTAGDIVYFQHPTGQYRVGTFLREVNDEFCRVWTYPLLLDTLPKTKDEFECIRKNYRRKDMTIKKGKIKHLVLTDNENTMTFENGSVIKTIKSNDSIRGTGFMKNFYYADDEDKNFKVGDYIYNKYNKWDEIKDDILLLSITGIKKYIIGKIKSIDGEYIYFNGTWTNNLPKTIEEFNNIINDKNTMTDKCSTTKIKTYKLFDNERQKIVDKMEVLKTLIDLYLDFKNKEAFNACVKEYKELEYKLNKSEVLV